MTKPRLNLLLLAIVVLPQAVATVAKAADDAALSLQALDTPSDNGGSVLLVWNKLSDEMFEGKYLIKSSVSEDGEYSVAATSTIKGSLKSDFPEYFGYAAENKNYRAMKLSNAAPTEKWLKRDAKERENRILSKKDHLNELNAKLASSDNERIKTKLRDKINRITKEIERLEQAALKPPAIAPIMPSETLYLKVCYQQPPGAAEICSSVAKVTPKGELFNAGKINMFFSMLFLLALIGYYMRKAEKNPEKIFLRRIGGLEAIENAIGRAAEMGKPVFFVHGLGQMGTTATIAAVNIMGKIAEKSAEYKINFKVSNSDPVVMAVSQETVKEAYLRMGRGDRYHDDDVFFVSQDQFSYASAVEGMMMRERPASNFFFGAYYAEALLLTEIGSSTGAIQVAGTDSYTQLPFFITTCDYTLMGEELYAASAYLSRNPKLLGSVKAQDVGKTLIIAAIIAGTALSSFGFDWLTRFFETF